MIAGGSNGNNMVTDGSSVIFYLFLSSDCQIHLIPMRSS